MNKRLIRIFVFSFSLLLVIQVYINVKVLHEKKLLKLNNINKVLPVISNNSRIFGLKDILELSEESKDINIVKLSINPEDKTKVNVEIEYNGAKESFDDILKLISSKENICAINNISLITIDEVTVKAIVNMDFIKNK